MPHSHSLLILTGPSCVGKSPLVRVLKSRFPDWMKTIRPLVLYNNRDPRPGEKDGLDYHFRTREAIDRIAGERSLVTMDVRGDYQALDILELQQTLAHQPVFFEGNPFIAAVLQTDPRMGDVPRKSLFVSPISLEEIRSLVAMRPQLDPGKVVTDVMRRKLLRRTRKHKGELSLHDLEDIDRRAGSAWREIRMAPLFDGVVINHDGEDHENWDAFPIPLGDARKAVQTVHDWFTSGHAEGVEVWQESDLAGEEASP